MLARMMQIQEEEGDHLIALRAPSSSTGATPTDFLSFISGSCCQTPTFPRFRVQKEGADPLTRRSWLTRVGSISWYPYGKSPAEASEVYAYTVIAAEKAATIKEIRNGGGPSSPIWHACAFGLCMVGLPIRVSLSFMYLYPFGRV